MAGKLVKADVVIVPVTERTAWRHVVVTCDDGRVGVGEYTLYEPAIDDLVRRRFDPLIGATATDGLARLEAMPMADLAEATADSALDQALRDLVAQEEGLPITHHLKVGATSSSVRLYANINRRTRDRSPDSVAASARSAIAAGYDAIKIAPFDDVSPDNCDSEEGRALIEAGLERLRAAAGVTAGDADLMVDCHWRFTTGAARSLIPELAGLGITWFECPIPETPDAVADLRDLRAMCADRGMRFAGCETMFGRAGFAPFVSGGAYDVIMPDVKHAGGLAELMRVAEDAERQGVAVSIHNPSGPIAHTHSVHATCALGGDERLEVQFDESPLFMTITDPPPVIVAGMATRPDGPGLGMRLEVDGV